MVLRWVAAGVLEATKGFHRVKGCNDMPALVTALRARDVRPDLEVWRSTRRLQGRECSRSLARSTDV